MPSNPDVRDSGSASAMMLSISVVEKSLVVVLDILMNSGDAVGNVKKLNDRKAKNVD